MSAPDTVTELSQLRARLAAAEAVIGALYLCVRCGSHATRMSDDKNTFPLCDACDDTDRIWDELPYAVPLRDYLALVGEDKR